MVVESVELPNEIAFLPIDESEQMLKGDQVTEQEKLVYVCRGQDD